MQNDKFLPHIAIKLTASIAGAEVPIAIENWPMIHAEIQRLSEENQLVPAAALLRDALLILWAKNPVVRDGIIGLVAIDGESTALCTFILSFERNN